MGLSTLTDFYIPVDLFALAAVPIVSLIRLEFYKVNVSFYQKGNYDVTFL